MISFKDIRFSLGGVIIGALAITACSEWDDHFEADSSLTDTQHATLWENIQKNAELSQFADLLKKTGYDQVLNTSQTYTVWAPVNGTFDYADLSTMSSDRLLKEFVQNHIARYNYTLSGAYNSKKIFMLNEKMMTIDGNGSYSIQNVGLEKMNVASSNGMLHTVKTQIPFLANIYESLNANDFAIDSISKYFHSFDEKVLNEYRSVAGPIVNGEMTYLDSIFDEDNKLYMRYRSYINREDSNYTMIVPTNEAWNKAKATVSQYFNYLPSFQFIENTVGAEEKKTVNVNILDTGYLKDSMVNMMLTQDLFYNNNLYDNKHLNTLRDGEKLVCDSLYGTTLAKVYSEDAAHLFENAHRVDKSNGAIWITDSLRMRTWTTWNPEIILEAERVTMLSGYNYTAGMPTGVTVTSGVRNYEVPGRISNNRYMEAEPSALNTNPEVDYYLPDIRSTEYSVYIVFVPGNITNSNVTPLPNRVRCTMGYADDKGKNQEERFRNPVDDTNFYSNDPTKIDTVFIGNFTFPVAYVGTGGSSQSYYPYLRIQSNVTTALRDDYDRTLRIDCIILRPKELDNYLKEHPDYRYDDGNY